MNEFNKDFKITTETKTFLKSNSCAIKSKITSGEDKSGFYRRLCQPRISVCTVTFMIGGTCI